MPYLYMQDVVQISLSGPNSPHLNIIHDHLSLGIKIQKAFQVGDSEN
jgi:hypothetical protein